MSAPLPAGGVDSRGWPSRLLRARDTALATSVLCLLVALALSPLGRFRQSILVIEAWTLGKETGSVVVRAAGTAETTRVPFDLMAYGQDTARLSIVELPAVVPTSLAIAPLATIGSYGIDRVTLANDTVGYFWDERGECSRRFTTGGVVKREPCGGAPAIATAEDGSILISSIPETGFAAASGFRPLAALGVVLAAWICARWLLRPRDGTGRERLLRSCERGGWLALAALFVFQFLMVVRYSVDVPFMDEWDFFWPQGLSRELSWAWLFSFHNEHRIVPTRLLAWLNLNLVGLDFALQKALNHLLFGCLLIAIVRFKNRVAGPGDFLGFPAFLAFLFSSLAVENHLWAFQSQFHLVLLFSVLAVPYACAEKRSAGGTTAFCLYLVLAMYTISAGVVLAAVYLACAAIFTAAHVARHPVDRRAGVRFVVIGAVVIVVGIVLNRAGYGPAGWTPPRIYPFEALFWEHFLNIVSLGFGFQQLSLGVGVACLALTIAPLAMLLRCRETRWRQSTWQLVTGILGILAMLATISVGRAYFAAPKTSRYAEVGFMLVPYASLAWWLALRPGRVRAAGLALAWLLCFAGFRDDWSAAVWAIERQADSATLECAEAYYGGLGDGICQGRTEPADLDRAKQLGVRFTRQFASPPGVVR